MIQIIYDDLLNANANFICHQVNCQGVMGSGIAKQIKEKWPFAYEEYARICKRFSMMKEELLGMVQTVTVSKNIVIVNIFGQLQYGRDGKCYTDESALFRGLKTIADSAGRDDVVAMPYRIGCGLGGGDWGRVMDGLIDIYADKHLTLYKR